MANELKIVCVCGSTRFCKEIAVYKWELEKRGIMAIGLHLLPPDYFNVQPSHQAEFEGVKDILDDLHFKKIDLATEVFVFNKNGYIGEQTRIEIEYAKKNDKKIVYLEALKENECKNCDGYGFTQKSDNYWGTVEREECAECKGTGKTLQGEING